MLICYLNTFFDEMSIQTFCPFQKIELFVFLYLILRVLYIFGIQVFYKISFPKIFSQSLFCLHSFNNVIQREVLHFDEIQFVSVFSYMDLTSGVMSMKLYLTQTYGRSFFFFSNHRPTQLSFRRISMSLDHSIRLIK